MRRSQRMCSACRWNVSVPAGRYRRARLWRRPWRRASMHQGGTAVLMAAEGLIGNARRIAARLLQIRAI